MICERCKVTSTGFKLFDYCAECGKNLCDACMAKGCCGEVPALSGGDSEEGEEDGQDD
jgi:hypothetical protein